MDGFVAGEVPLVAEGGLAAVTLVGLVAVHLQGVPLEGGLLGEPAVALVAEEGSVLWEGREGSDEMDETGTERPAPKWARVWLGEVGRGRQREFWDKEGGPDVFVVSHAMTSPAFSRTQDQRAWLEREEATRATSPSVTPATASVKLLLRSQRGPQQHPSYQASSEGGISSGPPAPSEVQTFMSTDVYIENGKTAMI